MESLFADSGLLDDEGRAVKHDEQARKFYMAMTRAAERLVLLTCEPLPAAWAPLFVVG